MDTSENGFSKLQLKILLLEEYIAITQNRDKRIIEFLEDIKELEDSLTIDKIYKRLIHKYKEGLSGSELAEYIHRSKKIFHLACGFVTNKEEDKNIIVITEEIHEAIYENFDHAFELFKGEFLINEHSTSIS